MKLIITLIILALFQPYTALAWTGRVLYVTDGDTIRVMRADRQQLSIKLYGIDAPERDKDHGDKARKYLTALVDEKYVEIETVSEDRYGRTVGIVFKGTLNINELMIRAGHAWLYRRYCARSFCYDWSDLEARARAAKAGLWQQPDPTPPWKWRRRKK